MRDETVTLDAECIAETAAAILCRIEGDVEEWIPLSQVSDASDVLGKGDEGDLIITRWIAEKKGLACENTFRFGGRSESKFNGQGTRDFGRFLVPDALEAVKQEINRARKKFKLSGLRKSHLEARHRCSVCGKPTPEPTQDRLLEFAQSDTDYFMWPGDDPGCEPPGWEINPFLCPKCIEIRDQAFKKRRGVNCG